MQLIRTFLSLALVAAAFPAPAQTPALEVIPASPAALELVHLDVGDNGCGDIRGVVLIEGGLRVMQHMDDRNPFVCDSIGSQRVALGAFAPGCYRVERMRTFASGAPAVVVELARFVVLPGPASTLPSDDSPREDLSGVWTSPTQPSTGLFLVHSLGELRQFSDAQRPVESVTGFWAVFEPSGAPVWYLLAMEEGSTRGRFEGAVVRYTASGTGTSRVVAPVTVGTVVFEPMRSRKRFRVNVDGQELEFDIEPLRWTRAAWPGTAPSDF